MSLQSAMARMSQISAALPATRPSGARPHGVASTRSFDQLLEVAQRRHEEPRAHHAAHDTPRTPSWWSSGQPPGLRSGPTGSGWSAALPAAGRPFVGALEHAAERAGIDPALLGALAWTESGFRTDAVSGAGARGLTQLMPATAAELGVDPDDPMANLDGGARYLAQQIARFGRVDHALAAYNAGPSRVAAAGGIPDIAETRTYVARVLDRWTQLSSQPPGASDGTRPLRTDALLNPIRGE